MIYHSHCRPNRNDSKVVRKILASADEASGDRLAGKMKREILEFPGIRHGVKQGGEEMEAEKKDLEQLMQKVGKVPNCFQTMQAEVIDYELSESLTIAFPVLDAYLNPNRSMQGGFIVAAFDNVFGPLSNMVSQKPTTTINLETSFQRPIFAGDQLKITARVCHRGRTAVHMAGEAYNQAGKLIATASTNYLILD